MAARLAALRQAWSQWRPRAALRWAAAGLALLLLASVAILLAARDAERLRPPIIAAVERATGRNLALGSIPTQTLLRRICHRGRRRAITLVIRDNLHAIILPNAHT